MVTRMRAFLLLNLCAMSFWHAASDPRCKVQGYYQSAPFIFSCAGSGGDLASNKAQVRVAGGKTQEIFRVPQGTKEFAISLSGDASGDLVVFDGTESVVPLTPGPSVLKGSKLHEYYKGMHIRHVRSSGSPTAEKVTLSGAASPELSVRLVNHAASPSDFTLGFYYSPYASGAAPCQQGGAPLGCKVFDRTATLAAVVDWVRWLKTQYTDAEIAWATLPLSADNAVPFFRWCQAWNAWPVGKEAVPCDAAYKFATDGGLEANIGALQKEQFNRLWALPQTAAFDDQVSPAATLAPVVATLRPTPTPTLSPTPTPRVLGSPTPAPSPVPSPSPTPAAIPSGTTCQGFNCPHPLTLRFQPEGLLCDVQVPAGCSKTVCCLQPIIIPTTTLFPEAAGEKPLARRRRRRRRRKHNQNTKQGATPAPYTTPEMTQATDRSPERTPAPTPAPKVTQAPPVPDASLRVPTVFHYNETANRRCAGEPYTHVPSSGCDGWSGITPEACQEKCADSERAPNCPRRPCMAVVFYASSTWCHAFTADQCLTYVNQDQVTVYKKIPGGAPVSAGAQAPAIVLNQGQSTAVAQPALTPNQMFHKKHIPFLVGGAVAGVAAGAAVMTGIGLMITSVHSPPAPAGSNPASNPMLNAFKPKPAAFTKPAPGLNAQPQGPPPPNFKAAAPGLNAQPQGPPPPNFKAKVSGARTSLAAIPRIGDTTIEVHSIAGFAVGDRILIGSEYGVIKAFSSIILEQPLTQQHTLGDTVKVAPQQKLATTLPPTTTMTTTTTMAWYAALSAGNSNGPMLPLACLFFVCLCGLVSLIIAAILDPCKGRKGRKVPRGTEEFGGSVASVGSVGSTNSEWDYYDSDGYDSYGNSVAYTDNLGGSQAYTDPSKYSQYGEYYPEQQPLNKWGFPN